MKTPKYYIYVIVSAFIIMTLTLSTGCDKRPVDSIEHHEEEIAPEPDDDEFRLDTLAPAKDELRELFMSSEPRYKTSGGIAHYQFDIRLGHRPFDVVRIHRVVRERRSFHPAKTRGNVFMIHGAPQNFESMFLEAGAENPSPKTSVALYLAKKNIDVWGMDFAWTKVPEGTTDFSFMQDWGAEKDAKHTLAAMSIARFFRGLTGQGFGRMNLLGYSYGASLSYVAAEMETQQHRFLRDIRGIIPIDATLKVSDPENSPLGPCDIADFRGNVLANGNYVGRQGLGLKNFGQLAQNAPKETAQPPPLTFETEGFTNYQVALGLGIFRANFFRPYWHFFAGEIESGKPVGMKYTDPSRWIELMVSLPPYMPLRPGYEINAAGCGNEKVSIGDHLTEISVPILYLGAGGGTGKEGYYSANSTASDDVTTHTVTLNDNPPFDFGHADLLLADNAPDLVWNKIHGWIVDHSDRGRRWFGR